MALKSGRMRSGLRNVFFSPNDIDSLAHWYDATEISGSDGDAIGTWADQEGNADLTQSTSSKKPTFKLDILNEYPIVRYDGSDDILDVDSISISQPVHHFVVVAKTDASSNDGVVFDLTGASGNHRLSWRNSTSAWRMNAGSTLDGGSHDNDFHIRTALFDGASSVHREDATQIASGDAGSEALDGYTSGNDRAESTPLDGDIAEILIYNASLSTSDRDDVESYLSKKWGIDI